MGVLRGANLVWMSLLHLDVCPLSWLSKKKSIFKFSLHDLLKLTLHDLFKLSLNLYTQIQFTFKLSLHDLLKLSLSMYTQTQFT